MKYFTLDQYPAKLTHYCSYWANNPPPLLLARKHTAKNFEEKKETNMEKRIFVGHNQKKIGRGAIWKIKNSLSQAKISVTRDIQQYACMTQQSNLEYRFKHLPNTAYFHLKTCRLSPSQPVNL